MEFNKKKKLILVTLFELHELTGYSKKQLNNFASGKNLPISARGQILPREKRGLYNLFEAFKWFLQYYRNQINDLSNAPTTKDDQDARLSKLRADSLEIDIAKKLKLIIAIPDIIKIIEPFIDPIRQMLISIPNKYSYGNNALKETLRKDLNNELIHLGKIFNRFIRHADAQDTDGKNAVDSTPTIPKSKNKRLGRPKKDSQHRSSPGTVANNTSAISKRDNGHNMVTDPA